MNETERKLITLI